MTSTNHFRGRRLSSGATAPVSPRPKHSPYGIIDNPPPQFVYTWSLNVNTTWGLVNIIAAQSFFIFVTGSTWQADGVDSGGQTFRNFLTLDSPPNTVTISTLVLLSGTYRSVQNPPAWGYTGTVPFDSGPKSWPGTPFSPATGSTRLIINFK